VSPGPSDGHRLFLPQTADIDPEQAPLEGLALSRQQVLLDDDGDLLSRRSSPNGAISGLERAEGEAGPFPRPFIVQPQPVAKRDFPAQIHGQDRPNPCPAPGEGVQLPHLADHDSYVA
jgi:hypothetical protein